MATLFKETQEKSRKIREQFELVEVWECDLRKKRNFQTWKTENEVEVVEPLNPQEAFFGGRTNVVKLSHEFAENENGKYVDFVSPYPTVNFFKKYPVGHATEIFFPEKWKKEWFGFVKCKVLAPRGLYHPVLPVKTKCGNAEKLLFPLCRKCSETQDKRTC